MAIPAPAPFVVTLDDSDDPTEVIDALAIGRFVAGVEPWARSVRLSRVREDAPLLPPGAEPSWSAEQDGQRSTLAMGDGWTLRSIRWRGGSAVLMATAVSDDLARQVLADASADAVEEVDDDADEVVVGFWHQTRRGTPSRTERTLTAEPWGAIARNYTATAAAALEQLMGVDASGISGRLVLLHGPPGTGKTTALRALGHAWQDWCGLEVVLDPDRFFEEPAYLLAVALGDEDDDDELRQRWRLLVLEDCDELIRADAKRGSGQALARLLNLADGLMGQGLKVLLGLTTNEPLAGLHPAIVRPGRCLAEVHVDALTRAEAERWLGGRGVVSAHGATLAELLTLRGSIRKVEERRRVAAVGQYL